MNLKARPRVVFVSHANQLEDFGRSAAFLRKHGLAPELWVVDARDGRIGASAGFDRVVNLVEGFNRRSGDELRALDVLAVETLEATVGRWFHRDASLDRSITGFTDAAVEFWLFEDRWSYADLLRLASLIMETVRRLVADGAQIAAVVGETNTLPYRAIYHTLEAAGIPHLSPTHVAHCDGRMYFEDQLGQRWQSCVATYHDFRLNGLPASERRWAEAKHAEISEDGTIDSFVAGARRGAEPVAQRLAARRTIHNLQMWHYAKSADGLSSPRMPTPEAVTPAERAKRLLQAPRRAAFYERLALRAIPRRRYAVYFLHVQPEFTVECLAFEHQDQVALIRNLASTLDAGTSLFVKDHKLDAGRRSKFFYGELTSIPGVTVIHDSVSPMQLIRGADFVATLSGTVALEAMCCGVPAVVFGDAYYREFEGVLGASSIGELREQLGTSKSLQRASREAALCALAARRVASHPTSLPWIDRRPGVHEGFARALVGEMVRRGRVDAGVVGGGEVAAAE